jgi:hypothetical protein
MRFVVDVRRTPDDRVEGVVVPEGAEAGLSFSGWMELLSLLEPPRRAAESASAPARDRAGDHGSPRGLPLPG